MKISIANLRAAGITDAQIVRLFEEAEAKRREQNRISQRNHRLRKQNNADGADRADIADGHIDILSSLTSTSKEVSKKERKISIAADWQPTADDRDYAIGKGWTTERVAHESERFHNHYLANGETRKNWSACWRKWVTSTYQQTSVNGNGHAPPRPGSREDVRERNARASQKLSDFIARNSNVASGGGPTGETTARLLPFAKPP